MNREVVLRGFAGLFAVAVALVVPAAAANAQDSIPPYWVSLKDDNANARAGPSTEFKILWKYQRKNLPLKIIRKYKDWRQIEDVDGTQTWMLSRLLKSERTAIVVGGERAMRDRPRPDGRLKWRLAPGVVGKLGECKAGWCVFDVNGRAGYTEQAGLWGAGEP